VLWRIVPAVNETLLQLVDLQNRMTAKKSPKTNPDNPAAYRTRQELQALRRSIALLNGRADALGLFDPLDVEPSFVFEDKR
jgi:hypothetical protein